MSFDDHIPLASVALSRHSDTKGRLARQHPCFARLCRLSRHQLQTKLGGRNLSPQSGLGIWCGSGRRQDPVCGVHSRCINVCCSDHFVRIGRTLCCVTGRISSPTDTATVRCWELDPRQRTNVLDPTDQHIYDMYSRTTERSSIGCRLISLEWQGVDIGCTWISDVEAMMIKICLM